MKDEILKCKSKSDVCRLYGMPINGRYMKKVDEILKEYEISPDIFDERKIYDKNPKYCINCGKKISYEKKENMFCNSTCSATYNNKKRGNLKEDTKEKISESLKIYFSKNKKEKNVIKNKKQNKKRNKKIISVCKQKENKKTYINKICPNCNNIFMEEDNYYGRRRNYCSKQCAINGMKKNLSITMKTKVKNGLHKGWQSRNILSYPEKFFIEVLKNNNLFDLCKVNFSYGGYFLDFYFENKKIDLEIDGKQHEQEERIIHDIKRTDFLISENIKVYRIKWKNINTENGKQYIKNEIDNFLKFYYNN